MYGDNMFKVEVKADERTYGVKPMNCPAHVQIFNQGLKSYRDLPIRMAEFGCCHRNEPSGAMHGIMRVRQFTQDDAHIFCTRDQMQKEAADYFKLQLGVTPAEYLLQWRISLAQSMLLAGSSIKLASEKLGYASAASFSRAFVQSVGLSPRAWLQDRQA